MDQSILDQAPETDLGHCHRLFLDLSSTCTGYVVARMEGRKCTITRAGVMWFGKDWPNGKKYNYLQSFITNELYVINAITDVVYESYHVNPKQVGNSLVVPEMIGAMKACLFEVASQPLGCEDIPPTAWRAKLGIQPIKSNKLDKFGQQVYNKKGKAVIERDYKTPVINYMDVLFENTIPKSVRSNITGNSRATPNDLYDALGVCIGWHKKFGCDEFIIKPNAFDGVENDYDELLD